MGGGKAEAGHLSGLLTDCHKFVAEAVELFFAQKYTHKVLILATVIWIDG